MMIHKTGCVNSETDHLGECLVTRLPGSRYVHASYCAIEVDDHDGPCLGKRALARAPRNYGFDGDGAPMNAETAEFLREEQNPPRLLPLAPQPEKIAGTELKTWTPEHPTIEVGYEEPDGFELHMSMVLPNEMRRYYDGDMALRALSAKMATMLADVATARHLDGLPIEIDAEPTGD